MRLDLRVVIGHAPQFQHVAPAFIAVSLLAQFGPQPTALGDPVDQFRQLQFFHRLLEILHQRAERGQRLFRRLAERGMFLYALDGLVGRDVLVRGPLLQLAQRLWPDLAVRNIDDTPQAQVIVGVEQQAQVGHHVLDFLALVELAAAYDLVGDVQTHELLFKGA